MKKLFLSVFLTLFSGALSYAQTTHETQQQTKGVVGASSLPDAVQATLDKEFAGYVVVSSRKNDSPDLKEISNYEVKLMKGESGYLVIISDEGKILKKTAVKAEAK